MLPKDIVQRRETRSLLFVTEELDGDIDEEEVKCAISQLKADKVTAEMFKHSA